MQTGVSCVKTPKLIMVVVSLKVFVKFSLFLLI